MGVLGETWKVTRGRLELTSLKGVPRVLKARRRGLKALWFTCTLGLFVIVVYHVCDILMQYIAVPTVISFSEEYPGEWKGAEWHFPAATVCNLKPVHVSASAPGVFTMRDYIRELKANVTALLGTTATLSRVQYDAIQYLHRTPAYYSHIGPDQAIKYGVRAQDFIMGCSVRSLDGDVSYDCADTVNITLLSSPEYFNCYTVSIPAAQQAKLRPYRLSLVLYLDNQDDFINEYFSSDFSDRQQGGVKLALHSNHDPIDLDAEALSLPPGYLSSVQFGLAKRKWIKDCREATDSLPYGKSQCFQECLMREVDQRCGCQHPDARASTTPGMNLRPEVELCGKPSSTFSEKLNSVACGLQAVQELSAACYDRCPAACEEIRVYSEVTMAAWPRPSQQLALYSTLINNSAFKHKFTAYERIAQEFADTDDVSAALQQLEALQLIRNNFLKVDVIKRERNLFIIKEEVKWTPSDVLATVGSLANLYSGITLVVAVELLDLVISLIYYFSGCGSDEGGKREGGERKMRTRDNGAAGTQGVPSTVL